jgi:cytochrome c-type biogenesis protein
MGPVEGLQTVTLAMAFVAGLLSFASPCVLPIVPSFLGFISGMSFEEMTSPSTERKMPVLFYTLWFVAGFSLVFIALGASATAVGGLLLRYQTELRMVGGALIIILGLQFMGLFKIGFLQLERRFHLKSKPLGTVGAFLVGVTFALGWTPCVGPILGSVLMVAASEADVSRGVLLLGLYSLGFALPFVGAAAAINAFLSTYRRFSRHIPKIIFASGAFLVVVGILLLTNRFALIAETLTAWGAS